MTSRATLVSSAATSSARIWSSGPAAEPTPTAGHTRHASSRARTSFSHEEGATSTTTRRAHARTSRRTRPTRTSPISRSSSCQTSTSPTCPTTRSANARLQALTTSRPSFAGDRHLRPGSTSLGPRGPRRSVYRLRLPALLAFSWRRNGQSHVPRTLVPSTSIHSVSFSFLSSVLVRCASCRPSIIAAEANKQRCSSSQVQPQSTKPKSGHSVP